MRSERGSAATEWVLVVPAVVLLIGVMVAGARLAWARSGTADAANAAARAATLQRSAALADHQGRAVGLANLELVGCQRASMDLDVSGFRVPVGQPARVTAPATCVVPLSGLLVPGLPGSITVTSSASAVLDAHRGRR